MDLTQLANLGEFIGGVAVLVTLVYLAVQVRQVKQTNLLAASDKNADLWFDVCNSVIDNFELFCHGAQGREVTQKEMVKFTFLMNEVFGYMETFHAKFERGAISAHLADGFLTVTLPKRAPERRRVDIEGETED